MQVAVLLVSNGRDGISADSRKVDRAVTFLVDLADEDDHVAFDKVKAEWHLLDTLVHAVDTLFGIGEDNVGFLVIACEYADYSASILKNEEYAAVNVTLETGHRIDLTERDRKRRKVPRYAMGS